MSLARTTGQALRFRFKLSTPVDVYEVADHLGLVVVRWNLGRFEEMSLDGLVLVHDGLTREERRWDIAHGIGHHFMSHGNLQWFRKFTQLGEIWEHQGGPPWTR